MATDAIGRILVREGWPNFTNDLNDAGGATKGGITLATLQKWRNKPCTPLDVANLTEDEVRAIYEAEYVKKPGFDQIRDPHLREVVVDCGVLHGPADAMLWLRTAVGLSSARDWGAINSVDPHCLVLRICATRVRYIGELITKNYKARKEGRTQRDQAAFALGWLIRATEPILVECERGLVQK